jgi:hypothetical protein
VNASRPNPSRRVGRAARKIHLDRGLADTASDIAAEAIELAAQRTALYSFVAIVEAEIVADEELRKAHETFQLTAAGMAKMLDAESLNDFSSLIYRSAVRRMDQLMPGWKDRISSKGRALRRA